MMWSELGHAPLCGPAADHVHPPPEYLCNTQLYDTTGLLRARHPIGVSVAQGWPRFWKPSSGRPCRDQTRGPSLVLILDDLHVVRTREALDALTRLCDHLPAGTKLVVASREVPPLPLARLRAHGLLLELGPADLALAGREARRVLELA